MDTGAAQLCSRAKAPRSASYDMHCVASGDARELLDKVQIADLSTPQTSSALIRGSYPPPWNSTLQAMRVSLLAEILVPKGQSSDLRLKCRPCGSIRRVVANRDAAKSRSGRLATLCDLHCPGRLGQRGSLSSI